ncbi:MAG: hypothetical protein QOE03_3627 [Micromonosporaceae bacterium]|nr:hypothetical protein [Micromonosporaceae bacterium]
MLGVKPFVNDITAEYIRACRDDYGLRQASVDLALPETYAASYAKLLLARPLLIEQREMVRFADDLIGLFDLLVSLPARCFDGDLRRYCRALGMDAPLADLIRLGATGRPQLYGRADAYHDGTSLKLLEFNVGSELGGIDTAQLNRAYGEVEPFGHFARHHGLTYVDTAAILADALRAAAPAQIAGPDPVVALVEGVGGLADHEHVFLAIQEAMRPHRIDLILGELDRVSSVRDKVWLDGRPIDVVLRYFSAGQVLADPRGRDALNLLTRAHEAGRTTLFTPLEGALFATKASLALVHAPDLRAAFTPDERAVVDRIVPWTRIVATTSDGGAPGDQRELLDRCRAERESLILKPGIGYGGVGAVLGREVGDREWADALAGVAGRDYVVQRIVVPAAEPVCDPYTGQLEDWRANWGVFATRDGYAGAFVRALKASDGSVISYSNPGTRGTCVFTYPSEAVRGESA